MKGELWRNCFFRASFLLEYLIIREIRNLMARVVTDYLDASAVRYGSKCAFADENRKFTFKELKDESCRIAASLIQMGMFKKPVAVYLDKGVQVIAAFFGALYSGNFYSPLDTEMPLARIHKIMDTLEPSVVITDAAHKKEAENFCGHAELLLLEDVSLAVPDMEKIEKTVSRVIDTDILYVLFTSGSTGTPKGVVISHKALIDFVEWGTERFGIDDSYIFANQTPFYFSMSVFDIYQTVRNGATTYIVPKQKFSFPALLMEYLAEKHVNTLYWVPTALSMVSILGALDSPHLNELSNVFFSGEVMPTKQLNRWLKEYPYVRYANLYGPTELTDVCTVYEVNRSFEDTERLPMGQACRNMDVFLLNERDELVNGHEIGEVCVRGTGLAYGYYNDPVNTKKAFVQNPLNHSYPELIYRTGDLAQWSDFGELVYVSRKDFQIKHMGHRIELGEIESAVSSVDGVDSNCCLYNTKKSLIILFYTGSIDSDDLTESLKELLPTYMIPNRKKHLEAMPLNLNGKIDRQKLKELAGIK